MAFTEFETDTANISKLSDRPNQNDGLSSAQLKGRFDKAGNDIKTYINDVLLEELERTTDGDSGADNIGATAVGDGTATTVQGILEEIDADVTALDGAVVHKTGNETIAGVKTFSDSPIVPTPTTDTQASTKKYVDDTDGARKTYVDNLDALAVHLAKAETVTGVKTFSASPIVPAPTSDTQASTKKYVDDLANARYTKTNLQTEGQALVHWGNLTNVPNLADAHWKTPVATKSALPVTGNSLGDNRVVLDDGDGKQAVYTCVATTGTYTQQWSKVGDVDWMTEEATRQTQETARVNAEGSESPKSGRVGAELDRVAAENARILAEGTANPRTGRIGAELDREDAEDAREAAELLRQAHITDKDNPHEVTAAQAGALSTTDAGDLAELTTTEKGSLVGAINETQQLVSSNSQFTDTNDTVYSWRFIKSAEGHMQLEYTEVI
jgi:mRNA-degrading endonuclease HigB of HigAB toxin-antitoxin module